MKRIFMGVAIAGLAAAALTAAATEAKARPATTQTDTATAYFAPAPSALAGFDSDLTVTATRVTSAGPGGKHTESRWFDKFTLYDHATGAPSLSCSATGALPENAFSVADDLQLAALDATAPSMVPEGDSATGLNDAAICPTISIRVLMTWHASQAATVDRSRERDDECGNSHRMVSAAAVATGVTINSPSSANPTVIQHAPSATGSIAREVDTQKRC
jgi:hypothetical protein